MSNENALAIIPRTLSEVSSLAEVLAQSNLMPKDLIGKVPNVVVQILAGQELGLSPMAAIRGIHVIEGKPILAADTMVALVLRSGLAEYFTCTEDTDERVTYETKRKGSPTAQKMSWSTVDTKRAGVQLKDNWRMHPRAMMRARAKSALARDVYPDILAGTYDPDEIQVPAREPAPRPVQHAPSTPAEVVEDAVIVEDATPRALAIIDAAGSVEDLKASAVDIKALSLSDTGRAAVNTAYAARLAALKAAA
jgi:hypothetical protein